MKTTLNDERITRTINARVIRILVGLLLMGLTGQGAFAALVTLPDSSQTTTLSATVSEQCNITVPTSVDFAVNNFSHDIIAPNALITINNIVLASAAKQLRLSVMANAASFTPSDLGATAWDASDVSWLGTGWTNATGAPGTLSSIGYTELATADPDVSSCYVTALVFILAPKNGINRSGTYTLGVTWRLEAITP